jgi:hypothetical protein
MEIHCYRLDDTGFRVFVIVKNETIFRGLVEASSSFEATKKVLMALHAEGKLPE